MEFVSSQIVTESPSSAQPAALSGYIVRPGNHSITNTSNRTFIVQPNVVVTVKEMVRTGLPTTRIRGVGNACITLVAIFASHLLVGLQYCFVQEVQRMPNDHAGQTI